MFQKRTKKIILWILLGYLIYAGTITVIFCLMNHDPIEDMAFEHLKQYDASLFDFDGETDCIVSSYIVDEKNKKTAKYIFERKTGNIIIIMDFVKKDGEWIIDDYTINKVIENDIKDQTTASDLH
jgi:hypothetical protein